MYTLDGGGRNQRPPAEEAGADFLPGGVGQPSPPPLSPLHYASHTRSFDIHTPMSSSLKIVTSTYNNFNGISFFEKKKRKEMDGHWETAKSIIESPMLLFISVLADCCCKPLSFLTVCTHRERELIHMHGKIPYSNKSQRGNFVFLFFFFFLNE